MKRLFAAGFLGVAIPTVALAQQLPSPQFAPPPANDSSSLAATTGWVRSQHFLPPTGDISATMLLSTGSSVPRTPAARSAEVYNVLDYGAVPDGVTDLGVALRAIASKLGSSPSSNTISIPAGCYRLASAVVFSGAAPILQGQGYTQGPGCSGTGTWIKIDATGFTPITFSGSNARGASVRDLAIYQVHPAAAAGWTPRPYDYVLRIQDALGEVGFDNVLFSGVNKGIYADNSGRLNIKDVQGQFYTTGIEIDDCYDIARIQHLHVWPFLTSDPNIISYQEANADAVLLRRVDGIYMGHIFVLGMRSALHLSSGANGVLSKGYVDDLYGDFVRYGVWIDGNGTTVQITNATTQHNDIANHGAILGGGKGLLVSANNTLVQLGNWRTSLVETNAIDVEGSGNRVDIGNLRVENWNLNNSGAPAVFVADSGAAPVNSLTIAGQPSLQSGNGDLLDNAASNAAKTRTVQMNLPGSSVNEPRFYAAPSGGQVASAAVGPDANIDYSLSAKGPTGSLRLQANNASVLRVDNPNGAGSDLLIRSAAAAVSMIAETGGPNADIVLTAKGAGGVQLQTAGRSVLRIDNPAGGTAAILVRSGLASLGLTVEDGASNADLTMAAKGTGSVQLIANGGVVLRADNPAAGSSDLLLRRTTGSVAMIAEDPAISADMLLNAKGAGSVRLQSGSATSMRATGLGDTDLLVTGNVGAATVSVENAGTAADLNLAAVGASNSVRILANGGTALRADNPNGGDSNLLVRNGFGTVSLSAESGQPSANLALFAKGAGAVTAPNPPPTDSSTQVATTAFVKAQGFVTGANLGPLAAQAALPSAALVGTSVTGNVIPLSIGGGLSLSGGVLSAQTAPLPAASSSVRGGITVGSGLSVTGDQLALAFGSSAGTAVQGNDPRITGAAPSSSPSLSGTTSFAGFNSLTAAGASTGSPVRLAAVGGDISVDLWLDAVGSTGSVRLRSNGVTALRVDSPTGGTTDVLVRAGTGTALLSAEDPGANANIALAPKGTGSVVVNGSADNLLMSGSSSGGSPTIATTGSDTLVPLVLSPKGGGALTIAASGTTAVLKGPGIQVTGSGTASTLLGSSGTGGSPVVLQGAQGSIATTIVTSGTSLTVPVNTARVILGTGASTSFTLTMAASPVDGQVLLLECDQTIALSFIPGAGQTLRGLPSGCSTVQGHEFHYRSGDSTWRMDF